MNYFIRRPWDLPLRQITDEAVFLDKSQRRDFLKTLGLGTLAVSMSTLFEGCSRPTIEEIDAVGRVEDHVDAYPAPTNSEFEYGRPETLRRDAAEFCNFYEFTTSKAVYQHVDNFEPTPWKVTVDGLCESPQTFDLDDIYRTFELEERAYRHRCVETWAMCVPWTGFPLSKLLLKVSPLPAAKYVQFQTFMRPEQAAQQRYEHFPWPYTEGLTIQEAMNPLTLLATGIYGQPLPKQHGAPIRLVLPWKYGFKSAKSIVNIKLTAEPPPTFWNVMNPREYGFEANVDPEVPHPRWSQATEWMLGTRERFPTLKYNGYGDYVAAMYEA